MDERDARIARLTAALRDMDEWSKRAAFQLGANQIEFPLSFVRALARTDEKFVGEAAMSVGEKDRMEASALAWSPRYAINDEDRDELGEVLATALAQARSEGEAAGFARGLAEAEAAVRLPAGRSPSAIVVISDMVKRIRALAPAAQEGSNG